MAPDSVELFGDYQQVQDSRGNIFRAHNALQSRDENHEAEEGKAPGLVRASSRANYAMIFTEREFSF